MRFRGEIAILSAAVFYAAAAIIVKKASVGMDGAAVSFVRFVTGTVLIVSYMKIRRRKIAVTNIRSWALRGIFGAAAMILIYLSIGMIGSGRAIVIGDMYPVFVAVFGFLLFKEKISFVNAGAIVVCITGLVLIAGEETRFSVWGYVFALLSAMASGIAVQYLKKLREDNSSFVVYLSPCLFGMAFTAYTIPAIVRTDIFSLAAALTVGVLTFFAQIIMTYGFKYVGATKGSVCTLAEIPMVLFAGTFFGEHYAPAIIAGALIIVAGLLVNTLDVRNVKNKIAGKIFANVR